MSENNEKLLKAVRKALRETGAKQGITVKVTAVNKDAAIELDNHALEV
jgi:hypothetical protein